MGADRQDSSLTGPPKARPTVAFLAGLACFYLGCWARGAAGVALVVVAVGCFLLFAWDASRLRRLARARGPGGQAPAPPPAESLHAQQGEPPGEKRKGRKRGE